MTANTSALTISELLALAPEGCEWTIESSHLARATSVSGYNVRIYWDDQDPQNEGWAYQTQATDIWPEESGEINDAEDLAAVLG
jgi:hypothetical protein